MSSKIKNSIREEYNRLKKIFDKILKPKKEQPAPQWVLQPVRHKKF
jgi:hypothetical protein